MQIMKNEKKQLYLYENIEEIKTKNVAKLFTNNHLMTNWTLSEDDILKSWQNGEYIAEGWTLLKIKIKAYNFTVRYLYNREENRVIRVGDNIKFTYKTLDFVMNKLLKCDNFKEGLNKEQKEKRKEELEQRIKKDNL